MTIFNFISDNWTLVKNHCRRTMRKEFTSNEATESFKKAILISEHSPIRLLEFDWSWKDIPYWVSTEWSRHKFEKFISSSRNDRQDDFDRNAARQDKPVSFDGFANMQNLIDAWRKRLCFCATKEARGLAEDFKIQLAESGHKLESDVLVPNCIYRAGCPEFKPCGFYNGFILWCEENNKYISDIDSRYIAYNEYFYSLKGIKK